MPERSHLNGTNRDLSEADAWNCGQSLPTRGAVMAPGLFPLVRAATLLSLNALLSWRTKYMGMHQTGDGSLLHVRDMARMA